MYDTILCNPKEKEQEKKKKKKACKSRHLLANHNYQKSRVLRKPVQFLVYNFVSITFILGLVF